MSDSSDSENVQSDSPVDSETIKSDDSEVINISDPRFDQIDKTEFQEIQLKVKKHIDNTDKLKKLNSGQKDIQIQKKELMTENKQIQQDIIKFAEENGINKLRMDNGYILSFTTRDKPKPYNDKIIKVGIAEQLKHYKNNDTIETIGVDRFINDLFGSIDSKRKEGIEPIKSVRFIKPKSTKPKKATTKKQPGKTVKKNTKK